MVCDINIIVCSILTYLVLILILLEYGLRHVDTHYLYVWNIVLILILLEYGLRPLANALRVRTHTVLILILLEYGLRHVGQIVTVDFAPS